MMRRYSARDIWCRVVSKVGEHWRGLDVEKVKYVWKFHISTQSSFFLEVLRKVCRRDGELAALLVNTKYTEGRPEEQEYVLKNLGGRMYEFFDGLVQDKILTDSSEIKRVAFDLGKQHAAFSSQPFKLVYWDTFLLAMMDVLEDVGEQNHLTRLTFSELRAWQSFMHLINENMILGYQQGREAEEEGN